MAQFQVTSATLTQKAGDLQTWIGKLSTLKSDYETASAALNSKWDGEAKNAFQTTLSQNIATLQSYITEVGKYVTALQTIVSQYETTEGENVTIAQTR